MRSLLFTLSALSLSFNGFAGVPLNFSKPSPIAEVRALFFYTGGLVPLACYDTKSKKPVKQDTDCFNKIPDGTSFNLPSGVSAKTKGSAIGYVSGVLEVKAIGLPVQEKDTDWFAPIAYPSASALSLQSYFAPHDLKLTLSTDEEKSFKKLLKPKKKQSIVLVHKITADLDGDSKPDAIYSVNIPETTGSYHWSGIIVAPNENLSKAFVAYTYAKTAGFADQFAWFNASFDLDGDSKHELAVVHYYLADYEQACMRLKGKKLIAVPISHTMSNE
jgi:hypothetical protein